MSTAPRLSAARAYASAHRAAHLAVDVVTRARRVSAQSDSGMTTAEYAVGTVAACAFGGILYKVLTGSDVIALLTGIVKRALSLPM